MADGLKIRLLQIDAPELAEGECFAKESKAALS
jgi:endonuclease YncB( thermonuclease family)